MSDVTNLGFLSYRWLEPRILEVTVHENVVLSEEMVDRLHADVVARTKESVGVLINRVNRYEVEPEAMMRIADLGNILIYTVYMHNPSDQLLIETQGMMHPDMRVFTDRRKALAAIHQALAQNP